jgi:hypothetical protein
MKKIFLITLILLKSAGAFCQAGSSTAADGSRRAISYMGLLLTVLRANHRRNVYFVAVTNRDTQVHDFT